MTVRLELRLVKGFTLITLVIPVFHSDKVLENVKQELVFSSSVGGTIPYQSSGYFNMDIVVFSTILLCRHLRVHA